MLKIKGNRDGKNRRNKTYNIPGVGKTVPRKKALQLYDQGKLDKFGVTTQKTNGRRYLKDIPDKSKKDNVNRK